jgi:hypothetical protein
VELGALAPVEEAINPCGPPEAVEKHGLTLPKRGQDLTVDGIEMGGDMKSLLGERRDCVDAQRAIVMVHPVD